HGELGLHVRFAPGPVVAEPELRQNVDPRRLGTAIVHGDANEDVVLRLLRVLGNDVEVPVPVEPAAVDQLELRFERTAPAVFLDEARVRIFALRVLIESFHVRVRRRRIEVVVTLLAVFAVIAFAVGETEEAFFQNRIALVPQSDRETDVLMVIADAEQTVFAPAIGATARDVVTERVPRRSAWAIILAHRSP